jgi:hypothetical protein
MSISTDRSLRRLTEEQVSDYARDGFLILRNVFSAEEIAALEREASGLWWRQDLVDDKHYAYSHAWLKERYAEYGKHGVWFK